MPMPRASYMNLPNSLTIFRIFLIPLVVVVLLTRLPDTEFLGAAIFLAAALTDWLDGYMARRRHQITRLGTWLDPIADKLLVASIIIALVELQLVPTWMAVIIIGRELIVTGIRIVALVRGFAIEVSELGKLKMATQVFAVTALILGMRLPVLGLFGYGALWLAIVLALASAAQYFRWFRVQVGVTQPRTDGPPALGLSPQPNRDVPAQQ